MLYFRQQTKTPMIEISEAQLAQLSVHTVGNKSKEEGYTSSAGLYELDDELENILFGYFLRPFKGDETYKLSHDSDLNLNEIYSYCKVMFQEPEKFHLYSVNILKHLYNQSEHPHIKRGEVYIVHFRDIILEGEPVEAIGIFKSEKKDIFLRARDKKNFVMLDVEQGIDVKKLDKGCLIFNTEEESGYRVMVVDQNNYDTHYWMDHFLGVKPDKNEVFLTSNVINLCKDFSKKVVAVEDNAQEEALFMAKSVDYFQKNEQFDVETFAETVIGGEEAPARVAQFQDFKNVYEKERELEPMDDFEIVPQTVVKEKRKIKNSIDLDTNIQIKMNFNDLESGKRFIERGYDPAKEMYYYKVYFNHEKK
ncbi:MAG: nucleoid-associated protein NdpA [Crocinitomicaceae bacterium]|nr:nucleoid-associated protein NdpA [Crocinitomicaceae bacterium]|tara:strand:+ start:51630 stop:52721 length:1092 start_codon:yes stop_codon:yes gene_type:complete